MSSQKTLMIDFKGKIYKTEDKLHGLEDSLARSETEIDEIMDKQEYLENSSRRNNVKILGIPEKSQKHGKETWEESEIKAIEAIRKKLEITYDLNIERAHRVGRPRPKLRHIEGTKVENKPRPIVVRFQSWKDKEMVVCAARKIRPEGMQFLRIFRRELLIAVKRIYLN